MLQVLQKRKQISKAPKYESYDTIVTKWEEKVEYNDQGDKIIRRVPHFTNLTKQINETAKLIKNDAAMEKLDELKNLLTK